jgi:hypothetical protein
VTLVDAEQAVRVGHLDLVADDERPELRHRQFDLRGDDGGGAADQPPVRVPFEDRRRDDVRRRLGCFQQHVRCFEDVVGDGRDRHLFAGALAGDVDPVGDVRRVNGRRHDPGRRAIPDDVGLAARGRVRRPPQVGDLAVRPVRPRRLQPEVEAAFGGGLLFDDLADDAPLVGGQRQLRHGADGHGIAGDDPERADRLHRVEQMLRDVRITPADAVVAGRHPPVRRDRRRRVEDVGCLTDPAAHI